MNAVPAASAFDALPLFPLHAVLFPQGLLSLKVFEVRYLDLLAQCLREGTPFGVVRLVKGGEVRDGAKPGAGSESRDVVFEDVGCLSQVESCDSQQSGILNVRCRGGRRFRLDHPTQQANGLWTAHAVVLEDDEHAALPNELVPAALALGKAIKALALQGTTPFLEPYRLDDAGWVANRWCEILPISAAARQKLMELEDPVVRLRLVDEFLRSRGVIGET